MRRQLRSEGLLSKSEESWRDRPAKTNGMTLQQGGTGLVSNRMRAKQRGT
jgi:hypothetical protein